MAWQSKDGAEHESDVTRKLTVYNDSCNSDNEDNFDDSLEDDTSFKNEALEDMDDEAFWDSIFQKGLQAYDDEKIQEFLNEEIDEDLMPMVFSAQAQQDMIAALADAIGVDAATEIVEKQAKKLEWERAQWKHERRLKRRRKVIKGISAAAAVIVILIGVGYFGEQAGAWSLPKISFNTIDRENYSDVMLESSGDIVRTEIEQVYELGMVLDGYELVDSIVMDEMSYFTYANSKGEMYSFTQQIEALDMLINTEYKKEEIIDTLYGETIWCSYDNINCLIWNYQGYTFLIEGNLSKEQSLELQNHLKIKD